MSSLFDDLSQQPQILSAEEIEETLNADDLNELDEEDSLYGDVIDIDPNKEFLVQYNMECAVLLHSAHSNKSVNQIINEQAADLGLPNDRSKLRVSNGHRYLDDPTLNAAPELGVAYILSIGHDSKQL